MPDDPSNTHKACTKRATCPIEGLDSATVISAVDDMFAGASPLHTIKSRDAWLNLLDQHGWQVHDAAEVVAVNHFELPMTDLSAQIQTQFLSATAT